MLQRIAGQKGTILRQRFPVLAARVERTIDLITVNIEADDLCVGKAAGDLPRPASGATGDIEHGVWTP